MSRRYLGVLAGVALLILVIGIAIRPRDSAETTTPTESSLLQQLSQEGAVRAEAAFLQQRIAALSDQVVYLPDAGPAVRWSRDTVVATSIDQPVRALSSSAAGDTLTIAAVAPSPMQGDRVIIVARQMNGTVVSGVAIYGGRMSTWCGNASYETLVLNTPLQPALAGGGIFDVSGGRVGITARCGAGVAAIPARAVERALEEARTPEGVLRARFGIVVSPIDANARSALGADSGLVVTELAANGIAGGWGLVVGDVILAVNDRPVHQPADLANALDIVSGGGVQFLLLRAGRTTRIAVTPSPPASSAPASAATSFTTTSVGLRISSITPSDRLYRAGLRPGDEITRIDAEFSPNVASLRRIANDTTNRPVLVVYRRGTLQRAVFLPPR